MAFSKDEDDDNNNNQRRRSSYKNERKDFDAKEMPGQGFKESEQR